MVRELEEIMESHGVKSDPGLELNRKHFRIEQMKAIYQNEDNRINALPEQIKRLDILENGHVEVDAKELDKLELRAKCNMVLTETVQKLIKELTEAEKLCLDYRDYLDTVADELKKERNEIKKKAEDTVALEKAHHKLVAEHSDTKKEAVYYERMYLAERSKTDDILENLNQSNEVIAEMTGAAELLLNPCSDAYHIDNLPERNRRVISAIVKRGKKRLEEEDIDVNNDFPWFNRILPPGIMQELPMWNWQEEEFER